MVQIIQFDEYDISNAIIHYLKNVKGIEFFGNVKIVFKNAIDDAVEINKIEITGVI